MRQSSVIKSLSSDIDAALEKENLSKGSRGYLGASAIGDECLRKIQYQYRDPAPHFEGRILRIFERGHVGEESAVEWLRKIGFVIKNETESGKQIGFISGQGKYRGHCDGIILETPYSEIKTPAILEVKFLGSKGWKKVAADGVAVVYPTYYAQISQYQAYMSAENPALFMAVNADTQEIYFELVKFNAKLAQSTTDKAVQILKAEEVGELLPRAYPSADFFKCKWCSYSEKCWS